MNKQFKNSRIPFDTKNLASAKRCCWTSTLLLYCFFPKTSSVLSPLQVTREGWEAATGTSEVSFFTCSARQSSAAHSDFLPFPLFVLRCRFPPLLCSTPGKIHATCKLSRQGSSLKEVIIRRLKLAVEQAASSLGSTGMLHTDQGDRSSISLLPPLPWNIASFLISLHPWSLSISTTAERLSYLWCFALFFLVWIFFSSPHLPLFLLSKDLSCMENGSHLLLLWSCCKWEQPLYWAQLPLGRSRPSWD